MATFLDTTAISHHLNTMIKGSKERLILISPFLRFNPRIKVFLEDLSRQRIEMKVVYGKAELQPDESEWLSGLELQTYFLKNLHAKCYLNEDKAIITSMNLYQFSQENNAEMGILVDRSDELELYTDIYEEARRIVRASKLVKISVESMAAEEPGEESGPTMKSEPETKYLSTTKLAAAYELSGKELFASLSAAGWLQRDGKSWVLTPRGRQAGGTTRKLRDGGEYPVWPDDIELPK